jgi:hypothetical protein
MAGTSIYLRWVLENWSKSGVLHSIQWQKWCSLSMFVD